MSQMLLRSLNPLAAVIYYQNAQNFPNQFPECLKLSLRSDLVMYFYECFHSNNAILCNITIMYVLILLRLCNIVCHETAFTARD